MGIINDVHLSPESGGSTIELCKCLPLCHYDLGVYASESTPKLLDYVTDQINATSIMINGDFSKHGVALPLDQK